MYKWLRGMENTVQMVLKLQWNSTKIWANVLVFHGLRTTAKKEIRRLKKKTKNKPLLGKQTPVTFRRGHKVL